MGDDEKDTAELEAPADAPEGEDSENDNEAATEESPAEA